MGELRCAGSTRLGLASFLGGTLCVLAAPPTEAADPSDSVLSKSWEHDIDDPKPYTLRLRFKDGQSLEAIERLTPAVWQSSQSRWNDEDA